MKPVKIIKTVRVWLSVAILLLTTVLVGLNMGSVVAQFQFMTSLVAMTLGACLFWLGVTLLLGRVYCSSVCPLGTVQDAAAWLSKRLRSHGRGTYRFVPADNRLRYLVLLLVAVSVTDDNRYVASLSDPYMVFRNVIDYLCFIPQGLQMFLGFVGAAVVMAAVTFLAWRGGRTFCNTVCPVGTVLGTVSKVSVFHFEIDPDLCISCGRCEQECKAACVNSVEHTIDGSRCVMCANCAAVCPAQAIRFTSSRKRLSTPLMQKIPQLDTQARVSAPQSSPVVCPPRRKADDGGNQ